MLAPLTALALTLAPAQAASQPAPDDGDGPASMPASRPAAVDDDEAGPASQPAASLEDEDDDEDDDADDDAPAEPKPAPAAPPPAGETEPEEPGFVERVFGPADRVTLTAGALTSRPGFSESANTLQRGGLLFNASLNVYSTLNDGLLLSATALDAPDVLLRIGVFDYLEVRVGGSWQLRALRPDTDFDTPPPVFAGVGQLTLGGTARVLEERGVWPGAAVILSSDVPLSTLRLGEFSARGTLAVHKQILGRLGLGANLGAAWDGRNEQLTLPYTAIATIDIGLGVGAYGELFGAVPLDQSLLGVGPSLWADAGLYYDVTGSLRLDGLIGVSALGSTGDWLAQIGLTYLL